MPHTADCAHRERSRRRENLKTTASILPPTVVSKTNDQFELLIDLSVKKLSHRATEATKLACQQIDKYPAKQLIIRLAPHEGAGARQEPCVFDRSHTARHHWPDNRHNPQLTTTQSSGPDRLAADLSQLQPLEALHRFGDTSATL